MNDWYNLTHWQVIDGSLYVIGEKIEPGNKVLIVSEHGKDYFYATGFELDPDGKGYKHILYGGTKYQIREQIKDIYFSKIKNPEGFPLDVETWTVYEGGRLWVIWSKAVSFYKRLFHKNRWYALGK